MSLAEKHKNFFTFNNKFIDPSTAPPNIKKYLDSILYHLEDYYTKIKEINKKSKTIKLKDVNNKTVNLYDYLNNNLFDNFYSTSLNTLFKLENMRVLNNKFSLTDLDSDLKFNVLQQKMKTIQLNYLSAHTGLTLPPAPEEKKEKKEREVKVQEKKEPEVKITQKSDKYKEEEKKQRQEYKEKMTKLNKQQLVPNKPKEGERTILDITDDIVKHYQTKKGNKSGYDVAGLKKELITRLNENKILLLKDIIRDTDYIKGNKYYDIFSKHGKNFHVNTLLPRYEQQQAIQGTEDEERSGNENVPNWKVLEILYNNFSLKNRKDVINTTNLLAQIPNGRYISEIITSENVGDLYPTPQECLTRFINDRDLDGKTILEPSAGMGSIIYNILMRNLDDIQINAVEYDVNMSQFLKHQFPNVGVKNANFLTTRTTGNNYDLIICNPPFTHYYQNSKGKSTYDNSYFINFYFKCCDYLRNSINTERLKILYFISPLNFFNEFWNKNHTYYLDKDGGYTQIQYFSPALDDMRNMTKERIEQIKKQSDVYNMYENFEEYYDAIMPGEAALLPYKCMFQTTGAKVYFYRFMFF